MNIFFLELRNLRKSILLSTVSICGVIFFMLLFYPSFQTEAMQALAGAKLEGIDPALLEALGLTRMMDFTVITNFFGYVLQFITLAIMVVITQRAVGLLSKEESDGTIEFLYAKPVSRTEIYVQKSLAHLASLLIMLTAFAAVTVIGYLQVSGYTFGETVKESLTFFGSILFVGLVFSAVGILISALLRGGRSISGITVGIVFGTFIIGVSTPWISSNGFPPWTGSRRRS